ncbi:MAG: hypothetical protein QOD14_391 [Solirubrobacterales bacterium]|jgi:hypothetical protein|nr:hypothetical protein [Solirubrobacterales bacterium]
MSAHYGAPGLRRPQMATPAFSAVSQGSSIPAPSAGAAVVKRKAMLVAAATLCAPTFAVLALAAIGATGGGNQAGMGSLAGTEGLRGSTVAATTAASPAQPLKRDATAAKRNAADPAATHHARQHPAGRAPAHSPTRTPAHPPRPAPSTHIGRTPTHTNSTPPTAPTYDPNQPGAPTSSGGTTGTTGTGGTTTTGSGVSGSPEGQDVQPGGG